MLDDAGLLNSSIAQPYNFASGYAYGAEASLNGQIFDNLSDFVNYTYEIAKGQGINGGIFAFPVGQLPVGTYQFLDHVQVHTATAGLNWKLHHFSAGTEALYGSGLRTGPHNSGSLPSHFSMDLTAGYQFQTESWWGRWKLSGDVLNVFNNVYPITVANGFNGSHYAAGREYFIHLSKEL